MHREDLHRPWSGLQSAAFEPAFLLLGSLQPAEEAVDGRAVGRCRELRSHLGEGIQVRPGGGGRVTRPREHLDIEPERSLGLADQLGQRHTGVFSHLPQGTPQPAQAAEHGRGQALPGGADPAVRRELFERLGEADDILGFRGKIRQLDRPRPGIVRIEQPGVRLTTVGTGQGEPEGAGLLTPVLALPLLGPGVEGVEIGDPHPAGCSRQQPHEGVATSGVSDDAQRGEQVDNLRGEQQTPQTDDFVGHVGGLQGRHDRRELRALAT